MNLVRLNGVKHILNNLKCVQPSVILQMGYASDVSQQSVTVVATPKLKIEKETSKAMKAYLERAREHDEFMEIQNQEFKIGKRHLANMMGEDPDTFTQEDIDRSIEYLFPSGLFDKRAVPLMKPPEEVFPARKAAEFDATGRPHHSMFYTGKPNLFKLFYDSVEHINALNEFEDRMIRKQNTPDPALKSDLSGTRWLTKEELENVLVEGIAPIEYGNFVNLMDRLVALPYSYRIKEFYEKYRKALVSQTNKYDILQPKYDKDGRMYVTTYECLRKRARGDVTIRSPGTGKISINGQDITYFDNHQSREQKKIITDGTFQRGFN